MKELTRPSRKMRGLSLISRARNDGFIQCAIKLHLRARCSSLLLFDCDCRMASCVPIRPGTVAIVIRSDIGQWSNVSYSIQYELLHQSLGN